MLYMTVTFDSTAYISATYHFSCFGGYTTGWWDPSDTALKLTFIEDGDWAVEINTQKLIVVPGQLKIYPPKTSFKADAVNKIMHSHSSIYLENIKEFEFLSESEFRERIHIVNSTRNLSGLSNDYVLYLPVVMDLRGNTHYVTLFREIIEEFRSNRFLSKFKSSLMAQSLLISLSRQMIEETAQSKDNRLNARAIMINQAITYINENYIRIRSVQEVADHIKYNPNYLGTVFKKHVGKSMNDYINSLRVENARQLICSRNMTIKDVAVQVGISDIYYFSKLFKKFSNMTASQYAKLFPGPA